MKGEMVNFFTSLSDHEMCENVCNMNGSSTAILDFLRFTGFDQVSVVGEFV